MRSFALLIFLCFRSTRVESFPEEHVAVKRQTDISYGSPAYKYCECGRRNPFPQKYRIIGGQEVTENEFPWVAVILGNGSRLVCGGSIINDRYVLTAAHCLVLGYKKHEMKVVVGVHNICKQEPYTVAFSIEKLIPHPKYQQGTHIADIMLVKLVMKMTFNEFVRPICLPKIGSDVASILGGLSVSVLGWGAADIPDVVCGLRSAEVVLRKPNECPTQNPTLICAGYAQAERGSCQGDSGGPLQFINGNGKFHLIGIVSSGIGCGDVTYPDFYTNVPRMVPWIMKVTLQDSMYCWR